MEIHEYGVYTIALSTYFHIQEPDREDSAYGAMETKARRKDC